jgi:hypothetical protein
MKLEEALRTGAVCGLETVEEALANIYIHSPSLFKYEEIKQELEELYQEALDTYGESWRTVKIPQELIEEENRKMDEYFESVKDQELGFDFDFDV